MSVTIRRTNSAELMQRRVDIENQLMSACYSVDGEPISRADLHVLAAMGCLSIEERDLYDELRKVEMLLTRD